MTKHLAKGLPRHVPHITAIKSLDDLPIQKCRKPCCGQSDSDLYHCPLCPVDKFKATYHSRLMSHLKVHFQGKSIEHKGWSIIPCSFQCGSKPNHLHCPFCTATGPNKTWLRTHFASCTEENPSNSATNTVPENPSKGKHNQSSQKEDTSAKNSKAKRTSTTATTTAVRKTGPAGKTRKDEKVSSVKQEHNQRKQKIATETTVETPRRSGRARKKNKKYENDEIVFTPSKKIKKEPEDCGYSDAAVGQETEMSEANDQPCPAEPVPVPADGKDIPDAENAVAAAPADATNPVPGKVRSQPSGSKCEEEAPLVNKILVKQLGKQMRPGQVGVPTSVLVPEAMFSSDSHTPEELARTVCEDHDVQYECYSQGVVLTGYWDQVSRAKTQLEELLQTLRLQPEGLQEIPQNKETVLNHEPAEPSAVEPVDEDASGQSAEEAGANEATAAEEPATFETVVEGSITTDSCPEETLDATAVVKTELEVESEQPEGLETDATEAETEMKWEPIEADEPTVAEEENVKVEETAAEEIKDVSILDLNQDGKSPTSGNARKQSMRFRNRALFRCPDRATHRCDVCGYRSTVEGVRKHKLRKHPKNGIKCDICEEEFGMRYDMRLHRLHHFKLDGHMTSETEQWVKEHRPALVGVMLQDIEKEYSVKQGKLKSVAEDSKGQSGDSQREAGQNPADSAPPAQTIDPKSLPSSISKPETECVECHVRMSAENLVKHWQQEHCKYNLECSVCKEIFHKKKDWKQHSCQQPSGKTEDEDGQELPTPDEKQGDSQLLFRCKLCRKSRTSDSAIRHHFLSLHPVVFGCLLCGEQNSTAALFRRHYRQQHLNKLRKPPKEHNTRFPCTRCEQSFSKQAYLTLHLKAHVAADAPPQQCDQCGYLAQKPGQLRAHILAKHSSGVVCDLCGQTFRSSTNLRFHKQSIHSESKPLTCPECPKVFSLARFLKVHIQRVHQKVRKHFCSICNRGFFEKVKMKEHEQTHLTGMDKEAVKRFECSTCGKRFMKKVQMQQHENIHLNYKPFSCSQCSKHFGTSAELRKHSFSHSDERPYRCIYCNKGFKFKAKLNAHTVIHTQKGGFTCEHCGHVFTARYTLRYHSCRAKDRPVQIEECKLCSRQFASHHLLRYHTCTGKMQPAEDQSIQIPGETIKHGGDQELLIQMCLECGQLFKEGGTHVCGTQQDSELVQGLAMEGVELRDFKKQNEIHLEVVPEGLQTQQLGATNADVMAADSGEITWQIVDTEQQQEDPVPAMDQQEEVQVLEGQADEVVYMCGVCNKLFPSQEEVQIHIAEHGMTTVMQTEEDGQHVEMSVTGDAEAELQVVEMEGTDARTLQTVIKAEELESVAKALADLQG